LVHRVYHVAKPALAAAGLCRVLNYR